MDHIFIMCGYKPLWKESEKHRMDIRKQVILFLCNFVVIIILPGFPTGTVKKCLCIKERDIIMYVCDENCVSFLGLL